MYNRNTHIQDGHSVDWMNFSGKLWMEVNLIVCNETYVIIQNNFIVLFSSVILEVIITVRLFVVQLKDKYDVVINTKKQYKVVKSWWTPLNPKTKTNTITIK